MGTLVDQLVDAIQTWSERTGEPPSHVSDLVMYYAGGLYTYDSESDDEDTKLNAMVDWLEHLVADEYFNEPFLVVALIRQLTDDMESRSEDTAKYRGRLADDAARLREIEDDAAERERFIQEMNERLRELNEAGEVEYTGTFDESRLQALIASHDRLAVPTSLEDLRQRRIASEVWQEVTAPILNRDNLDSHRR